MQEERYTSAKVAVEFKAWMDKPRHVVRTKTAVVRSLEPGV